MSDNLSVRNTGTYLSTNQQHGYLAVLEVEVVRQDWAWHHAWYGYKCYRVSATTLYEVKPKFEP